MFSSRGFRLAYFFMFFLLTFLGTGLAQVHDTITGRVSTYEAISVARPVESTEIENKFHNILLNDLSRSSVFSIVKYSKDSPVHPELAGGHLVPVGARYLLLYGIESDNIELTVTGYLVAARDSKPRFARQYKVAPSQLDLCAHQFNDDIVEQVTGTKGVASNKIAFIADYKEDSAIYTVYPDGSRLKRIVSGPFLCLFPRFSPSRNWLIYTAYKRGFPEMFIIDVNSGKNLSVTPRLGLNSFGAISPDGSTIAATLSCSGNPEIHLLSLTGKMKKQLTASRGCDLSPVWSGDGKRIAYVSDSSGAPHIYVMQVDDVLSGSEPKRLTWPFNAGNYCVCPDWSPKNNDVAFIKRQDGKYDVMIANADTGNVSHVATSAAQEEALSWAPDGRHLVVSAKQGNKTGLYILDSLTGGELVGIPLGNKLTGIKNPTWSRVVH